MKNKNAGLSGQNGFTLIEMMIVIAIAAIIMAVALPPLHRWIVRYDVNKQTATIYNALTEMRFRSLAHEDGKLWGASFTTNSMTTFSWNDKNFDGLVTSNEEKSLATYNMNYAFTSSPALLWFDGRGITRERKIGQTIHVDTSNLPAGLDAYDCIAIHVNRIREGKYNAISTKCIVK